ncbi:8795_t:CDS:2, partial [Gigaspora rosea]
LHPQLQHDKILVILQGTPPYALWNTLFNTIICGLVASTITAKDEISFKLLRLHPPGTGWTHGRHIYYHYFTISNGRRCGCGCTGKLGGISEYGEYCVMYCSRL